MKAKRIRAAWWSFLRDVVFPILGIYGLYQIFSGRFSDLAIPVVAGVCMGLLGLPFWDRDDRRREANAQSDGSDSGHPDNGGGGSGDRRDEVSIRIGLPRRRQRGGK